MHTRLATTLDQDTIHSVYSSAFAEDESEIVSKLAINLLSEQTTPPTISLVAENKDVIVAHVAFSPADIDSNSKQQGYILAPLAVTPSFQKQHIGSKLVKDGIQRLTGMGVDMLFVYGDPSYYGRFGFSVEAAECYIPPYKLEYPFGWQGMALSECAIRKIPVKIACVTSLCDPTLW